MSNETINDQAMALWDAMDTRARNNVLRGVIKAIVKDEAKARIREAIDEQLEASVKAALMQILTDRGDMRSQIVRKIERESWRFKVNVTVDGIDREDERHLNESIRW